MSRMRPRRSLLVLLLAGLPVLTLPALPVARAEAVSPAALVETLRYDPESTTALVVLDRLGHAGAKGWKALASVAIDRHVEDRALAERAVEILVSDVEPGRAEQAARAYDRVEDIPLRRTLALGLVRL